MQIADGILRRAKSRMSQAIRHKALSGISAMASQTSSKLAFGIRMPLLALMIGLVCSTAVAQHPRDYRGIDARHFNPGRGYHGSGNLVNGQYAAGVSRFGTSSATYSNGRSVAGVVRTPQGVHHLSSGLFTPAIVPVPAYGATPSLYGGGFGPADPYFYGGNPGFGGNPGPAGYLGFGGNQGYGAYPGYGYLGGLPQVGPPLTVDPFTGQLVPWNPWLVTPMPYIGVANQYPGSILVPTIMSMNLSMRPSVPSTASYTMIDPRMLDQIAPAPQQFEIPMQQVPIQPIPEAPPAIDRETPLLNEFESLPRGDKVSSLADKINSLRYQSQGDTAFRKEDYVTAEESYRDAIQRAPDRRSPWIRMALLQIAIKNFPAAAQHLKTALSITDDRARAWVSADELYGQQTAERARTHGSELWNWLAERPLSADRLLLAGAFQKFRGFDAAADELFELAHYEGPEADYVARIRSIADEDPGQRAISQELAQLKQLATTSQTADSNPVGDSKTLNSAPTKSVAAEDSDGILLRGSKEVVKEPVESSEELPQLIIPRQ